MRKKDFRYHMPETESVIASESEAISSLTLSRDYFGRSSLVMTAVIQSHGFFCGLSTMDCGLNI